MFNRPSPRRLRSGALMLSVAAIGVFTLGASAPKTAISAAAAQKQVVTGPVSVYWIDAATSSGFGMGSLSGGGRPSLGSMMNMMSGGASHTLHLRLGSNVSQAAPQADHMPPSGLGVGDLPLYYKRPVTTNEPYHPYEPGEPSKPEQPHGKILIFWGCGEHAPKTQPLVIDLSKITDPTAAQAMMKQMAPSITLETTHPPSPDTYKSFGEWPNEKNSDAIPGNASLVGAHTIKGNYTPQISLTLDQARDFLAPINVTGNERDAQGAVPLTWQAVPNARAFVASVIGGGQDAVVIWTSAATNTGWMYAMPDYMTPGDIDRLTAQNILLPGTATTCTVPAEVVNATGGGSRGEGGEMYSITAYGGEANYAWPERPSDPKVAWNIQWETKIRYRSSTGGILGQPMPGGQGGFGMFGNSGGGDDSADSGSQSSSDSSSSSSSQDGGKKKKKSSVFGNIVRQGIGSFIP